MIKKLIPTSVKKYLRSQSLKVKYKGDKLYCPICDSHLSEMLDHGIQVRENSVCPICTARERHRMAWLYFERVSDVLDRKQYFLHIAPEHGLVPLLKARTKYLSGNKGKGDAMVDLDITALDFEDGTFDFVYASDVLNALQEDRKAISEVYRVLKKGGKALLYVPLYGDETVEPKTYAAADRMELFGDDGIFRHYGRDYQQFLEEAGFRTETVRASDYASPAEMEKMSLLGQEFFICHKD